MFRERPVRTVRRPYTPSSRRLQRTGRMSSISRVPLHQRIWCEGMHQHFTIHRHTCRWRLAVFVISILHQAVLFQAFLSRVRPPCRICRYFLLAVIHSRKHFS